MRAAAFQAACSWIGLLLLWVGFAPLQLGGEVSYVIVDGISMTPRYKKGDLVLVRRADLYQIGDIVTYNFPQVGRVIHRIVGRDGLRFIIKGDANSWLDSYHPNASEILGKEWIHLPGAGRFLAALRSPGWMAGFVLIGVLMVGFSGENEPARKRKKHHKGRAALLFGKWVAGMQEAYYVLAFTLGLAALALGAFAFTRPLNTTQSIEIPYEQIGLYAYVGDAPDGLYDQSQLKSGDAVFPQVTCSVHMIFNYHLISSGQSQITGKHHFTATVSDSKGWSRTIEIQPETQVTGGVFQAEGDLNFCEIRTLIDEVQKITGAVSSSYQVTLSPNIELLGAIDGILLEEKFSPPLVFLLDPSQISISRGTTNDPLRFAQTGLVTADRTSHNVLSFFNLKLSVLAARWISAAGLLLSFLLLAWITIVQREAEKNDPQLWVELLTGQPPLAVQPETPIETWTSGKVVKVASLRDLARLSNSLGALIELVDTPQHLFFMVNDQGACYLTTVEKTAEPPAEIQPPSQEPVP